MSSVHSQAKRIAEWRRSEGFPAFEPAWAALPHGIPTQQNSQRVFGGVGYTFTAIVCQWPFGETYPRPRNNYFKDWLSLCCRCGYIANAPGIIDFHNVKVNCVRMSRQFAILLEGENLLASH